MVPAHIAKLQKLCETCRGLGLHIPDVQFSGTIMLSIPVTNKTCNLSAGNLFILFPFGECCMVTSVSFLLVLSPPVWVTHVQSRCGWGHKWSLTILGSSDRNSHQSFGLQNDY